MASLNPTVRWLSLFRVALVVAPFTLAFCLSPTALTAFGWEYVAPGGNPIEKVHPATYLAIACLGIFVLMGKWKAIRTLMFGRDYLIYYFGCWLALLVYSGVFLAVPFMSLIDTWLMTGLFCVLVLMLSFSERRLFAKFVDFIMFANTVAGIGEFLSNKRMVPLTQWSGVLGQWVYPHEWRSTAFLGHPLTNSYLTGAYMLTILLGLRIRSPVLRLCLLLLHTIGLFAFGSRGATAFLVVAIVIMIFVEIFRATQTGKIRRDILVITGLGIPSLALVIPAVLTSGVADKLIDRFMNDRGSAETRSIAIDVIMSFPLSSLVLGSPSVLVNAILGRFGLIAIENFWLSFLLQFGIVGCCIFWPAIFVLCRSVVRHTTSLHAYILIYFFACCTSSVSLASKNLSFAMMCVICLTSMRSMRAERVDASTTQPILPHRARLPGQVVVPA